jgi:hypothetical protein
MNLDAVIGCDAVDAEEGWLRLRPSSAVRTIPWTTVKIAGLGGNHDGHVTIQGITERVAPYFATHDSLWIVYAEGGFAQVMIEKEHPKREAILAAFEHQLGDRWHGDRLDRNELMEAMVHMPIAAASGLPRLLTLILIGVAFIIMLAMAVAYFSRHQS